METRKIKKEPRDLDDAHSEVVAFPDPTTS